MAESSWPSPSNSRLIGDDQYEKLALSYGPSAGVVGDFTSPQLVYGDASGMQVKIVADRYALVRGHEWWSGATLTTLAIAANASGSTRVDLIVLRLNRTTWNVNITVVQGTPGSGAPAPTQNVGTTGSYDLPLALVTVASGASSISAGNVNYIAAHLGPDGCGYRSPTFAALSYVPGPVEGMTVDLADGSYYRYHSAAWVQRSAMWIRKTVPTQRNNNTITADPDLKVTLPAGQTYLFIADIVFSANSGVDMKGGFIAPNNGQFYGTIRAQGTGGGTTTGPIATDAQSSPAVSFSFGGAGVATNMTAVVIGVVISGDGGVFSFNWAQAVTNASATTVRGNSFMAFIPMS